MTTETRHVSEPWEVVRGDEDDLPYVIRRRGSRARRDVVGGTWTEEDAKRIVTCVNAASGLSREALEDGAFWNALYGRLS